SSTPPPSAVRKHRARRRRTSMRSALELRERHVMATRFAVADLDRAVERLASGHDDLEAVEGAGECVDIVDFDEQEGLVAMEMHGVRGAVLLQARDGLVHDFDRARGEDRERQAVAAGHFDGARKSEAFL